MTAKFQFDIDDLDLSFATARELEAIEALREHGDGPKAAAALGLKLATFHSRIKAARQRMALGRPARVPPPEGFRVTKVAQRGDGTVIAVQSKPESNGEHLDAVPEGHLVKGVSTLLGSDGEVSAQWVKTDRQKAEQWRAFVEAVERVAAEHIVPALPVAPPAVVDEDLLTVLPWGDPHIGLLAWHAETSESWDLARVEEASAQVFADLISRTPRSGMFMLVDLGDLFHAEDDRQATPMSGHKLDVDSRAGKIARVAVRIFRQAIDLALQRHAKVGVRLLRGNHDPQKSMMLGLILEAWYANEPRVEVFPCENVYQYHVHGDCAFMWHHGDGSKPQQMGPIFSCHDSWGPAKFRYVQTGHIHTQNRWDLPGCTVESFRTIAAPDQWSHWKGYRSGRTLDAITYHRRLGEISRVQQGLVKLNDRQ